MDDMDKITKIMETPAKGSDDIMQKCIILRTPGLDRNHVKAYHDSFAASYDQDKKQLESDDTQDAVASKISNMFTNPSSIKVMDLGAGTGRMAELLRHHGFDCIDGLDPSPKMLSVAREKRLYGNLIEAFLGPDRLPIENDTYDLLVSVGVFFPNHADETCFKELIRITKPGGTIAIVLHYGKMFPDYAKSFQEAVNEMESLKLWNKKEEVVYNDNDAKERGGSLLICQKC